MRIINFIDFFPNDETYYHLLIDCNINSTCLDRYSKCLRLYNFYTLSFFKFKIRIKIK